MPEKCSVCGGDSIVRFPKVIDVITNEPFSIRKCEECGLSFTDPQPPDLSRYYGARYYGNRHGITTKFCIRRRLKFIDYSKINSDAKLLDVGCGDGSFLLAARNVGWRVTGVDIQPEDAKNEGLDVYQDIEQASLSGPFDCITMWHSLEHMIDPKHTLSQLSKLLKPDGHLFIAVPCSNSFQALVFGRHWIPLDVPRHLYGFNIKSLSLCLENAGLSVRRKWHTEIEYDLMGWVQSALNMFFADPNVFLDQLAGKRRNLSRITCIMHLMFGCMLTILSLPLVFLEVWLQRGGTLVVQAE